jgi:hypothetical protein
MGDLVPDRTDLDPALEQAAPRGLEVCDDEIDVAMRSRGRVGESATDLYRTAGARRRELHDAECVIGRVVDVERETDLVDIKPQRSVDIAHRQRDHLN